MWTRPIYRCVLALLMLCLGHRAAAAELVLWHAYRGQERVVLEQLLREYDAANPQVEVVVRALPYEGFVTKLEAAAPRGNGPDLFIAAHERLGDWVPLGLVVPTQGDTTGFHATTLRALNISGQTYGLPLAYKCLALFYDPTRISEPPTTTDALLELAREHTSKGRYGLAYSATEPYFHAPWMHGFGGGIFKDGRVQLDQAGNAAALRFARNLLTEGLIPDEPTSALVTQLFNDGATPMVINGPWFIGEIAPDRSFAVAPLPVVSETGLPAAPYLTVEAIQVSGFSEQQPAAWELARWLAGPESAITRAIQGRQSVAALAAMADPAVADDPILSAFRSQLDSARPMPNQPGMAATWEPQARAVRRVMRGAVLPSAAVQEAQDAYAILARPPPPEVSTWPYLVLTAVLLLLGGGLLLRRIWQARAAIRAHRHAYGWVLPAGMAMAILVIGPFVVGAAVSLFSHHNGAWTFVGLANFFDILLARDWPVTSPLSFWFTLGVTVLWTTANVALHVAIGVALAMLLRAPWLRLRGMYRVLLILPWAVPNYITALIWKGMFHRQFGAINGMLELVGVEPIGWFSQFSTAFAANLVTNTWLGFPFMMVVTLGALQAIPPELEEAAAIDGAGRWQRFRHVTWPLLRPALLPAVVLGSIWTFNMFNIIYLVSSGEPDGGTEILISEAYRWAFTRGHRYGYAAAYAVLIFGVLLVYGRATDRLLRRSAA
jgi:arabinogalactan oligomer/maltooligosaccharide transport system permease protein